MRFLYLTDAHGSQCAFNMLYSQLKDLGDEAQHVGVVIGGDNLPKGSGIEKMQKKFLKGFLREFFQRINEITPYVYMMFGNDDLVSRLPLFERLIDEGLVKNLDTKGQVLPFFKDGWSYFGYPYVPEYPFGLKDWVRFDTVQDKITLNRPPQFSAPCRSGPEGLRPINPPEHFLADLQALPSIEEDLSSVKLDCPERTIVFFHSPPFGIGDSVIRKVYPEECIGSKAIYAWIVEQVPELVLCGHIHEDVFDGAVPKHGDSNQRRAYVIQPGALPPRPVLIKV